MKQLYTIQFITRYFIRSLILVCSFPAFGQTPTENYIKTQECLNTQCSQKKETVMYYDGLGRPKQEVHVGASPTGKNLAIHYEYDNFGRQSKDYLPVPAGVGYDLIPRLEQQNHSFYHNHYGSSIGYSEKEIENSPLDRVLKQAAPGDSWKLGSGHEVKYDYQTNSEQWEVPLYYVSFNSNGTPRLEYKPEAYLRGSLYKRVTTDENGQQQEEFTDKEGQLIMKVAYSEVDGQQQKHSTNYVYDIYGNLTFVLPPLLSRDLYAPHIIDEIRRDLPQLGYQYKYDERNRLIEKKLPGKGWEYMVYDKQNRLVASQDANLRAEEEWLYTKYDKFGRAVVQGVIYEPGQTREGLQSWVNSLGSNNTEPSSEGYYQEGLHIYYTSNWPSPIDQSYVFSVYYYDRYPPYNLVEIPETVEGQQTPDWQGVKGLPTLVVHRVLSTNNFQFTYSIYDQHSRVIRTHQVNYLGGYHRVDTRLDFRGKPNKIVTYHKRTQESEELKITEQLSYDAMERLVRHTHQINNEPSEQLYLNAYDELGQLVNKKVGHRRDSPLQSVDYRYNIRGWLTDINDIEDRSMEKLFSFRIGYDKKAFYTSGLQEIPAQYNGNISETRWKTREGVIRSYTYRYDGLNRLKSASYTKGNYAVINAYNEYVNYDKNGNITSLLRSGKRDNNNTQWINDLRYSYLPHSNQLRSVKDLTKGILPDDNGYHNYTYDANGNSTQDLKKGVVEIRYNYLNLPETIAFETGDFIEYTYDASGIKLSKLFYLGRRRIQTDYLNGFHYENNELQFFPTPEGYVSRRVEQGQQSFDYVYQYRDHVGNNVMSYKRNPNHDWLDLLDQNHYYPFGLRHEGYNFTITPNPSLGFTKNHYKYNNKELQTELNLNLYDYGARNYDPTIGRWFSVDPLAEKGRRFSPYVYAFNNPVRFIDPDGQWAFGFDDPIYDKKGNLIGDDGKTDEKAYVVTGRVARAVKKSTKSGKFYTGSLNESSNVLKIPTGGIMDDIINSVNDTEESEKEHGGHSMVGDTNATRWDEGPSAEPVNDVDGNTIGAKATLTMFKINGRNEMPTNISNVEFWWHTHPKTTVGETKLGSSTPSGEDFKGQTIMTNLGFKGNTFVIGVRSGTVTFYNKDKVLTTIKYSNFKRIGGK